MVKKRYTIHIVPTGRKTVGVVQTSGVRAIRPSTFARVGK